MKDKAHPFPFTALTSLIQNRYPLTVWLTERVLQLLADHAGIQTSNLLHHNQVALTTCKASLNTDSKKVYATTQRNALLQLGAVATRKKLGPVVQSIVSSTSLFKGQLIKCFTTVYPNTLILLLKK